MLLRAVGRFALGCLLLSGCSEHPSEPVGRESQALKTGPSFNHVTPAVLPDQIDANEFLINLEATRLEYGRFRDVFALFASRPVYSIDPSHVVKEPFGDGGTAELVSTGLRPLVLPNSATDHYSVGLMVEEARGSNGGTIGLGIVRETFAFTTGERDDYVLVKYSFHNLGPQAIGTLYIGEWADFDIVNAGNTNGVELANDGSGWVALTCRVPYWVSTLTYCGEVQYPDPTYPLGSRLVGAHSVLTPPVTSFNPLPVGAVGLPDSQRWYEILAGAMGTSW